MSTNLTPTQQDHVTRARQFLIAPISAQPAYDVGRAVEHMNRLLEIIDDLTGEPS